MPPPDWCTFAGELGVEDRIERIVDGKHKAGGELLEVAAGVHQGGRIGKEVERRHRLVEPLRPDGGVASQTSSAAATSAATRRNRSSGVSSGTPASSRSRWRVSRTV